MIVKKNAAEIQNYLTDASNFRGNPDCVYIPESEEELIELVKKCSRQNIKLTVAGNGTGLTGGRVAETGSIVSLELLNKIIEINEMEKFAVLEPAVLLGEFNTILKQKNLYYPPDPTEQNCFIGATVATNASGAKSFKYGATRKFVEELRVILPDGEIVEIKRGEYVADGYNLLFKTLSGKSIMLEIPEIQMPGIKHAAGYYCKKNMDLADLFIGSEGTLGIITKIKLKLIDYPSDILSAVIFFDNEKDALKMIFEARRLSREFKAANNSTSISAMGLEFFDADSLAFLRDEFPAIPQNTGAAVWFEQDYSPESEEKLLEDWMILIENNNGDMEKSWFATDESDRFKFINFRHAVSGKVNEFISRNNMRKVGTDLAVPDDKFEEFYFSAKKTAAESGIRNIAYGHFGDSHLHLNMLPANEAEFKQAKIIYKELCLSAIKLGGTISAEHGVGKIKREYLLDMFGNERIRKMASIKKQLDRNLILNYGNIFFEDFLN